MLLFFKSSTKSKNRKNEKAEGWQAKNSDD